MIKVNEKTIPSWKGIRVRAWLKPSSPAQTFLLSTAFLWSRIRCLQTMMSAALSDLQSPFAGGNGKSPCGRHTPGIHKAVKKSSVGIMDLEGLGTIVAGILALIGIGSRIGPGFNGSPCGNCSPSPGKPGLAYPAWKGLGYFLEIYWITP
jgi:hypothetical protein